MSQYFDPITNTIKRQVYSWSDTGTTLYVADGYVDANYVVGSATANAWGDLTDWLTGTGGLYTITSGDPIVFRSEIKDLGRIDNVNPLCTVEATGIVNVKVFAANSIDSSSTLPGDPVINAGTETLLQGITGRYFQFVVEVSDDSDQIAEIRKVETSLNTDLQQEFISGNSSTHTGTTQARIAPIKKTYSKLTSLTGNAKAEIDKVPFVTIGDLGTPDEPRYTVFSISSTPNDSSTTLGIVDVINNTTITQVGTPEVTQRTFKWSPSSIEFGKVEPAGDGNYYGDGGGSEASITTTFNDAIKIASDDYTIGSTAGQDFSIQLWVKIWGRYAHQAGVDPEYAHPDHFFNFTNGIEGLRIRTTTQGTNNIQFSYQLDNDSTYTNVISIPNPLIAEGDWYFIRFKRTNSGIKLRIANSSGSSDTEVTVSSNSDKFGNISGDSAGSVWTLSLGDLDNPGNQQAALYIDDIKISNVNENSTFIPGAPFIADSDDIVLINAGSTTVFPTSISEVVPVDAEVNLIVTGLPAITSDEDGNIVLA